MDEDGDGDSRKFLKIATRQISRMEVDQTKQTVEGEDEKDKAARKLKAVIFRQKKKHPRLHSKTGDFFEESSSLLVL